MKNDINEPSPALQSLHESVLRGVEARTGKLPHANLWSFPGHKDPDLNEAVVEFFDVSAAFRQARSPLGSKHRVTVEQAILALDDLLVALGPIIQIVDSCKATEFRSGSKLEPTARLAQCKALGPGVHAAAKSVCETRVLLPQLLSLLALFSSSPERAGIRESQATLLYGYGLKKRKVPNETIAAFSGRFDDISPRANKVARKGEQVARVNNMKRDLQRFVWSFAPGRGKTCNGEPPVADANQKQGDRRRKKPVKGKARAAVTTATSPVSRPKSKRTRSPAATVAGAPTAPTQRTRARRRSTRKARPKPSVA